jgi:murein DD-endopeptidase MepM/ murein hydrolase activator NlpD
VRDHFKELKSIMQNDDKSYSFLLKHSSRSKIYIKRIDIPKGHLHFGSVGFFLILGITTFALGIGSIARSAVLAQDLSDASPAAMMAGTSEQAAAGFDYSRPATSSEITVNSGGPWENGEDGENTELAAQIETIRKTTNAAYIPSIWAHLGKINNEFGFRRNPFGGRAYEFHAGMDIDGERGDLVVATAAGTVIEAGYKGGYGNEVEIDHGNGLTTRYGHLSKIEVQAGDTVTRGQLIANVGSTGRSTGPHLHYELRLNDKPINPRHFLPQEPTDLSVLAK